MASSQQIAQGIQSILSIPADQRTPQDTQDLQDLLSEYNSSGSGFQPAPQQGQSQQGQQGQGQQGQGQGSNPPIQNGQPQGNDKPGVIGGMVQTADDYIRVIADSATRGFLDKALGGDEQAKTRMARQRIGWGGSTAADIGGYLMTSPYKVASSGVGALIGGAEGLASAYGHQKNWVPTSLSDFGNLATGTAVGAATGAVAPWLVNKALGGEARTAAADATKENFPINEAEHAKDIAANAQSIKDIKASGRAPGGVEDTLGPELAAKSANLDAINQAASGANPRDALAKAVQNMPNASPEAQRIAQGIADKPNPILQTAGNLGSKIGFGGKGATENVGTTLGLEAILPHIGIPYGVVSGARTTGHILDKLAQANAKLNPQEIEQLKLAILNPEGKVVAPDYSGLAQPRDTLSKLFIGSRTGTK
jgi:hypothetical protein